MTATSRSSHNTVRTARRLHSSNMLLGVLLAVIAGFSLVQLLISGHVQQHNDIILDPWKHSKEEFLSGRASGRRQKRKRPPSSAQQHNNLKKQSNEKTLPPYHIVFSTSCSDQQHWESMVFFYHAMKVKQPGNITRIASGCKPDEAEKLLEFHQNYIQPMSPHFHVHFTPDYSRVRLSEGKFPYKYMNKPYGMRHWMEEGLGLNQNQSTSLLDDGIVILMDPDMILLRPILHDFSDTDNHIFVDAQNLSTTVVKHGYPMAQQDGYLDNAWMKLNFSYITQQADGTYVPRPDWADGPKYWNTGPPYLATVRDMYKIVVKWTELAPRVLDIYPQLFAEMFGFIIATVQLKLPHTLVKSIVVSTTQTAEREGWKFIDALPDDQMYPPPPSSTLPICLHYCKRYLLGKWFFSKYRTKKNIMDCDKNLFKPPPRDLFPKFNYGIFPPRADLTDLDTYDKGPHREMSSRIAKREAFMLYALVDNVNEALRYHKRLKCGASANLNETYTVYDDPTNH